MHQLILTRTDCFGGASCCVACGRRYESVMSLHCWRITRADVMRVLSFHTAACGCNGSAGCRERIWRDHRAHTAATDCRQARSRLSARSPHRHGTLNRCHIPALTGGAPEVAGGDGGSNSGLIPSFPITAKLLVTCRPCRYLLRSKDWGKPLFVSGSFYVILSSMYVHIHILENTGLARQWRTSKQKIMLCEWVVRACVRARVRLCVWANKGGAIGGALQTIKTSLYSK